MQPHREIGFRASNDDVRLHDQRSRALELPPAVRRELMEQLRKADRPVLASIMPPG